MSAGEKEAAKNIKQEVAKCNEQKEMYDRCFNQWYRHDFLKKGPGQNACEEFYDEYRACISEKLHKAGLGQLAEFDATFLERAKGQ